MPRVTVMGTVSFRREHHWRAVQPAPAQLAPSAARFLTSHRSASTRCSRPKEGGPGGARRLGGGGGQRGGNWESGAGGARLAVGAAAVKPITAQLMSTPAEPYGAGLPVAGSTPVSRSGRVAARLNTTFSSD